MYQFFRGIVIVIHISQTLSPLIPRRKYEKNNKTNRENIILNPKLHVFDEDDKCC
jgi:hypothetical protein